MKTARILTILLLALAIMVCSAKVSEAAPMGTAFTYQGHLYDSNSVADGEYDFRFSLYADPCVGSPIGSDVNKPEVDVIDGYFTVELDFGSSVFDGDARWLQIGVRPGALNDPNAYIPLSPRQEVTPMPYAIYAAGSNWSNIYNIPIGFADGVDNVGVGDITAVWGGTGLSGGATSGDVTLHVGVPLELSGSVAYPGAIIKGTNSDGGPGLYGVSSRGRGVMGWASDGSAVTNYGGHFTARGYFGRAVYGEATHTGGGTNYGGFFLARGSTGMGVRAYANNAGNYTNYGGHFAAAGRQSRGVYGEATTFAGAGEVNYGGYFKAYGDFGRGVYGWAVNSQGTGVYGEASSAVGDHTNYGGYFKAAGTTGRGVYGQASNTGNYTNYGGYFEAAGSTGRGVYGFASGSTGRGVYGEATGSSGRAVHGSASGSSGKGVAGYSSGSSGQGVYGYASGSSAKGVYGYGGDYDFYAAGPGTNYGSSSSIRWKRDVRPIDDPLEKVLRLRGVYFNWDEEHGGHYDVGMIAEEVAEVLPEIVQYEENGIDATGMDYGMLTPLLVEAVKALKMEVNELQRQNAEKDRVIDTLKQHNDKLEGRLATLESSITTIAVQLKGGAK